MGLFLGLPAEVSQVRTQWAAGESGRAVTSALPLLELWCARLPSTAPNFTPDQFPPIRLIPHSLPRPPTIVNVCASPWDVVDSHSFLNHTTRPPPFLLVPYRSPRPAPPPPRARPHRPSTYVPSRLLYDNFFPAARARLPSASTSTTLCAGRRARRAVVRA